MKLCQRCIVDVCWFMSAGHHEPILAETAPESKCEFWAHKKLNEAVGLAQGALNNYLVGTPDDDDIVEITKRLAAIVGRSNGALLRPKSIP